MPKTWPRSWRSTAPTRRRPSSSPARARPIRPPSPPSPFPPSTRSWRSCSRPWPATCSGTRRPWPSTARLVHCARPGPPSKRRPRHRSTPTQCWPGWAPTSNRWLPAFSTTCGPGATTAPSKPAPPAGWPRSSDTPLASRPLTPTSSSTGGWERRASCSRTSPTP